MGVQAGRLAIQIALVLIVSQSQTARANPAGDTAGHKGSRSIEQTLMLGIGQAITTAPAAETGFAFRYDPVSDSYVQVLGPTGFRSAFTVGAASLAVQMTGSYLDIDGEFEPRAGSNGPTTEASARVGRVQWAARYGLAPGIELHLDVPLTIVSPDARTNPRIGSSLNGRSLVDDDTDVGLGRVSVGSKWALFQSRALAAALVFDVLLPSPNERELAGPESWALVPRVVYQFELGGAASLLGDIGYQWDDRFDELQAFLWGVGISYSTARFAADLGFGGSVFRRRIGAPNLDDTMNLQLVGNEFDPEDRVNLNAYDQRSLSRNYADFRLGAKYRVTDSTVVSAAISVPLEPRRSLRPDALGILSIELLF